MFVSLPYVIFKLFQSFSECKFRQYFLNVQIKLTVVYLINVRLDYGTDFQACRMVGSRKSDFDQAGVPLSGFQRFAVEGYGIFIIGIEAY